MVNLNAKEWLAQEIVWRNHVHKRRGMAWATTNDYSSGIGIVTIMRCLVCNKTFDITDYDCW